MTTMDEIRVKCLECALKFAEEIGADGFTREDIVSVAIRFERFVNKGE